MRLVDRTLNYFEDFEQKYKFSIRPEVLILVFIVFWFIHQTRDKLGNLLPNPINIFNHIGNVDSIIPALIVGSIIGIICTKTLKLNKKQILTLAVVSGTAVGLACNILIETSWGMHLLNEVNISDPLDVVWGTTFCLISCLAIFTVRDKK